MEMPAIMYELKQPNEIRDRNGKLWDTRDSYSLSSSFEYMSFEAAERLVAELNALLNAGVLSEERLRHYRNLRTPISNIKRFYIESVDPSWWE